MTAFVIIFEGPFFYQSSTRIFEPFWDSIYRFFSDRFFLKFQRFYLLQDGYIYILRFVAAGHVNTQDLQVKESGSFVRKNRVIKIGFDQCDSELSMTPALRTSTLPRLPAAACSRLDLYLA